MLPSDNTYSKRNQYFLSPFFCLYKEKGDSHEYHHTSDEHTSDILRKWPRLLLPRSKKNFFWSTLITLETPMLPSSSCGGSSTARSTFRSETGEGWLLWPDMKPAPTSSESPTICSGGSGFCCFGKGRKNTQFSAKQS